MTKNRVVLTSLTVLLACWWGVPTYRKARADATVRELCAKDGASHVYQVVPTDARNFDAFGEVRVPHEQFKKSNDDFYYVTKSTWIVPPAESPNIWREHYMLFQVAGKRLLGEAVAYGRNGGDPLGPWHPSGFHCGASIKDLTKQIFVKSP